jgi:hypothetical protein
LCSILHATLDWVNQKLLQPAKAFSTLTLKIENILFTLLSNAPNKGGLHTDDLIWLVIAKNVCQCIQFNNPADN